MSARSSRPSALLPFCVVMAVMLALAKCDPSYPAEDIPVFCTVHYADPIDPELLKRANIHAVYVYIRAPVITHDPTGQPILNEKVKSDVEGLFNMYGKNGIKLLLVCNFYAKPPAGTECMDFFGRKIRMGCFSNERFLDSMRRTITDMIAVFKRYDAFGGFAFDDGVHVRVDCCYCDLCKRLFEEKHGLRPPPFEPFTGPARVPLDEPILLWDAFHQAAYHRYTRIQAETARASSEDLFLATIPSDSYFYGRHLNLQMARDQTETGNSARLQRLERLQVEQWHIFQSFPFPKVIAEGTGLQPFGAGCHITSPSPGIIFHHEGPLFESPGRQQFLSPNEIRRLMRTTIAEGANAVCFWENARLMPRYRDAFDTMADVANDVREIQSIIHERKPYPARLGLVYSTTTEIVQQRWKDNTLERWQHLHAFEAMAYALTRRSVQFRIILENELNEEAVSGLDALILTGVTHMAQPVAERLEKSISAGKLTVLSDEASLPIKGTKVCQFDSYFWFDKQLNGYRQLHYLDKQARQIAQTVLPQLNLEDLQPFTLSSDSCFAELFLDEKGCFLIFLVNWDIQNESIATLVFRAPCNIVDELRDEQIGPVEAGKPVTLKTPPAHWRVLRCSTRP